MITLVLYYKKNQYGHAVKERKAFPTTKMRYLDKLLFFSFDHSQLMIVFTYNTASINKHSNGF